MSETPLHPRPATTRQHVVQVGAGWMGNGTPWALPVPGLTESCRRNQPGLVGSPHAIACRCYDSRPPARCMPDKTRDGFPTRAVAGRSAPRRRAGRQGLGHLHTASLLALRVCVRSYPLEVCASSPQRDNHGAGCCTGDQNDLSIVHSYSHEPRMCPDLSRKAAPGALIAIGPPSMAHHLRGQDSSACLPSVGSSSPTRAPPHQRLQPPALTARSDPP